MDRHAGDTAQPVDQPLGQRHLVRTDRVHAPRAHPSHASLQPCQPHRVGRAALNHVGQEIGLLFVL